MACEITQLTIKLSAYVALVCRWTFTQVHHRGLFDRQTPTLAPDVW